MKLLWPLSCACIGFSVAYWFAIRSGWLRPRPGLLAGLVALALILLLPILAVHLVRLVRIRGARWRASAAFLVLVGVVCIGGGGLANWLLSLQGWAIVTESEALPLFGGSHLQGFQAGPLANLEEMDLTLQLEELELKAAEGGFYPQSRIRLLASDAEPVTLSVRPGASARYRTLRFHQGAFGFAPRIVILNGPKTVFDRVVPFTTERRGVSGVLFEGRFAVRGEQLSVGGAIDLASLDEGMRGHATLRLTIRQGERLLGHGTLLPGHFAEIDEGYRVGFVGLEKWSEIDVSRRNYGHVVLAGAAAALVGGVLWPLAAWRGW